MLANDKRGAGGQGNTRVTDLCKAHFHVDCSTAVGPANTWCLQKKKVWSVSYRIACTYIRWGWVTETSILVTIATTYHISIYRNMLFPFEDIHAGPCEDGGIILKWIWYCLKNMYLLPIPVAMLSKAWVCSRLSAGIAGSIAAEDIKVCLLCFLCCPGSGLCEGLITLLEDSCRWYVFLIVCDLETSTVRRPRAEMLCCASGRNVYCVSGRNSSGVFVCTRQGNIRFYECGDIFPIRQRISFSTVTGSN